MKYRIQCDTCDWTLTDPNSVRVYVDQEELFPKLIPSGTDAITACLSEVFNLDPDGSCVILTDILLSTDTRTSYAFRISGERVVLDASWRFVCAECGHDLVQEAGSVSEGEFLMPRHGMWTWQDLLNWLQTELPAEQLQDTATVCDGLDEFFGVTGTGKSKDGDLADGILDAGHRYLKIADD